MKTADTNKPVSARRGFNSLKFQLLSRSLIILAVLLFFIGNIQYIFMRENTYINMAVRLQGQVHSITPATWATLLTGAAPETEKEPRPSVIFMPGTSLALIDEEGNYTLLISDHGFQTPSLTSEQRKQLSDRRSRQFYLLDNTGAEEQLVVTAAVADESGQPLGTAVISTRTAPLKELLLRHMLVFMALALVALLIGLLAFLPVLRRTLVPLSNMVDTAAQIDAGNLDRRFLIN
ncbi:MAG: two-component sensor histidine kinase, partial [Syntrophomonadaceae bacterium]|nr:two-component sensor histidine kinase [Syntrophomonadaceae bacterium]